ncbi:MULTISPECIES: hypothetical protein [Mumia]|uniref:Uncharacterized protein n=1 Tax=Mumia xiangluensis TaxID=1678900 RepID=A0ABW1QNC8_9ACTN|nr:MULTISPECIES: hypothetical protein [Mumia]
MIVMPEYYVKYEIDRRIEQAHPRAHHRTARRRRGGARVAAPRTRT